MQPKDANVRMTDGDNSLDGSGLLQRGGGVEHDHAIALAGHREPERRRRVRKLRSQTKPLSKGVGAEREG